MSNHHRALLTIQAVALGATLMLPAAASMAGGQPALTKDQQQAVVQHRADRAKTILSRRQQRHQVALANVDPATLTDAQRQRVEDLYRKRANRLQQIYDARRTLRQTARGNIPPPSAATP